MWSLFVSYLTGHVEEEVGLISGMCAMFVSQAWQ